MARIRVRLRADDLQPGDIGSRVRVVLFDTTQADALHETVAEATGVVAPGGAVTDAELDLPDGALDVRRRYSLWAHVDRTRSGSVGAGDLIVTESVPVAPDAVAGDAAEVVLPLTRV